MSFSSTAKDELIRTPMEKDCCTLAELSALTQTSGSLGFAGGGRFTVTYEVENTALARRIFSLLKRLLNAAPQLHFVEHARLGGRRSSVLRVEGEDARRLLISLGMLEEDAEGGVSLRRTAPRVQLTRQCCRRAFLRGAFLGAGSITNPDKSYHFELVAGDEPFCLNIERNLEKCGLPAHHHVRKGQNVVYLKGAQQIADVLALMGASGAVMELENIRITKQIRGEANRANNCDEHNGERLLNASMEQIRAITMLMVEHRMEKLPRGLQEIARLRLENTEMSLTELGQLMEPPVGKSGVNHRMRRLMEAAAELEAELQQKERDT